VLIKHFEAGAEIVQSRFSVGCLYNTQRIAGLVESERETKELYQWLKVLLAPGSSLGGARPKANLIDHRGSLWIAKFPSKNDTIDKAGWEFLACCIAKEAGIRMAKSAIERVAGPYRTFFTRRFDRLNWERIHFASAMTMTGNTEETVRENRVSYLELAEFIMDHCGMINEELAELWRRMISSHDENVQMIFETIK